MLKINETPTDVDHWKSFKSGSKPAFKEIYYKYYMLLYKYGLRYCGDEDMAEDSLQDLFLKIWNNRENLAEISSVKSYLYRAYTHTLIDAIKLNKRHKVQTQFDAEELEPNIEDLIIADQLSKSRNAQLNLALSHLTKRQKQVLNLYYYEGMSYKQISEIVPLQYQAIRNCVHEALKVLRKNITIRHFDFIILLSYFSIIQ